MKRKSRRERIGVGFVDDRLVFSANEMQWQDIEQAYGREIRPELRKAIDGAATIYLRHADTEMRAVFKGDIAEWLDETGSQAAALLSSLGRRGVLSPDETKRAASFGRARISTLLSKPYPETASPLTDLEKQLQELEWACGKAGRDLTEEEGFQEGEAWGDLILKLSLKLAEAGFPVGLSNDDPPSPFVCLFHSLQKALPQEFRRHNDHALSSLARAMKRARRNAKSWAAERDISKRQDIQ